MHIKRQLKTMSFKQFSCWVANTALWLCLILLCYVGNLIILLPKDKRLWKLVYFTLCLKCQCLAAASLFIFRVLHLWTVSEPRACLLPVSDRAVPWAGCSEHFASSKGFISHTCNNNIGEEFIKMSSQSFPRTSVLRALEQWNTWLHTQPCLYPALWAGAQLSQLLKPKLHGGCRSHVFPWHKFWFNFDHLNLHLCWKIFLEELPDQGEITYSGLFSAC